MPIRGFLPSLPPCVADHARGVPRCPVRLVRVCAYVVFWGRVKDGPGRGIGRNMSLEEASRQLEAAIHDARVSFDCILLEELDRAHTNAITARAAVDAAENALRAELEKKAEAKRGSAD